MEGNEQMELVQLQWLSVPEQVTSFKVCVLVNGCFHGLGPEFFFQDFRLVSEIHSRQRLRSASTIDVIVPPTRRSSLGDRAFPVAGHGHGTRYSPVSPPRRLSLSLSLSLFVAATSENFSVPATTASITLTTITWP